MSTQQPTWDHVHAGLARMAKQRGEWAGIPMPVRGTRMVIHPSYPFAENLSHTFLPEEGTRLCRSSDIVEETALRNTWLSYRDYKEINIWREGKKFFFSWGPRLHSGLMVLDTLSAARAWDYAAEVRAMETLKRHVSEWAYQAYVMTGSFVETSKRSGVIYMFRRLRPTIAMSGRPNKHGRDVGMRILCTLCSHPIGFYDGSWAGALVPTDDVISHLLLMRSDEHYFWRVSNQHHPLQPESGL
jgi:hypothetical protein